ncbi:MAG: hypothetical protein SFY66_28725 [Oculatellaceae cyanobacterium bins.114]|nr:hypothetical protein [Oculatellaceae cyanobacterium bins.114]
MRLSSALRLLVLGFVMWCSMAEAATANSWPPMAVWLLHIPLGAGLISYGIGLVAIALLEGFILSQRENLALGKSMIVTGLANLCSCLLGVLIVMGLAALPYSIVGLLFLGLLYGLLIFFSWSSIPLVRFKGSSQPQIWNILMHLIMWSSIWFALLLSSLLLIPAVGALNPNTVAGGRFPDPTVLLIVNGAQLLAVMLFVAIGFAISVVSEGFCLTRLLPQASTSLWHTVLIMNLRSYAYIAVPITLVFLMSRRSWL